MKFCIRKRSRFSETPSPYRGPVCKAAGVKPQWYSTLHDAIMDVQKLNAANPIGFEIVPVTESFVAEQHKGK
jgi:hypothetical protein